ncbi:MAG: 4-alpha-glucanotransferase, partial [Clostridia bacterium]|nr:4-alpha-glucanotransferase [Clostridia bacterium]
AARHSEERIVLVDFLRREGWLAPGEEDLGEILRACLRYLAASRAEVLMLNLEDLWLETAPQNRPGTGPEEPNWRHKARYALEDLPEVPGVPEILREVDRWRKREVH